MKESNMIISKLYKCIIYLFRYIKYKVFHRNVSFSTFIHFPKIITFRGRICFQGNSTLSNGDYFGVLGNGVIEIGRDVYVGKDVKMVAQELIEIGDNCMFGPNVIIYDHDHKIENGIVLPRDFNVSPVKIGSNCWIGAGAIILRGSVIGDGSIIGAGTVVKGEIPPKSLVYNQQNIVVKSL